MASRKHQAEFFLTAQTRNAAKDMESKALTVSQGMPLSAVVSHSGNSMDALDRIGDWFAKSGMFGADRPEQGKIMALTCMTEGLSPVEFSRTYDIVFGKLRKKSMAAFAEFRRKGGRVKWIESGEDGKRASADFTFEDQTVRLSYTIEEAAKAGLTKVGSGYDKNPANMLRARLISNALGMLAPEIFAGEYGDEQAAPMPEMRLAPEPTAQTEPKPAQVVEVATVVEPAKPKPGCIDFGAVAEALKADREAKEKAKAATPPTVLPGPKNPSATTSVPKSPMTTETATQLCTVLRTPEEILKATEFFVKQGWLAAGETIDDLSEGAAQKVIKGAAAFRQKVLGAA